MAAVAQSSASTWSTTETARGARLEKRSSATLSGGNDDMLLDEIWAEQPSQDGTYAEDDLEDLLRISEHELQRRLSQQQLQRSDISSSASSADRTTLSAQRGETVSPRRIVSPTNTTRLPRLKSRPPSPEIYRSTREDGFQPSSRKRSASVGRMSDTVAKDLKGAKRREEAHQWETLQKSGGSSAGTRAERPVGIELDSLGATAVKRAQLEPVIVDTSTQKSAPIAGLEIAQVAGREIAPISSNKAQTRNRPRASAPETRTADSPLVRSTSVARSPRPKAADSPSASPVTPRTAVAATKPKPRRRSFSAAQSLANGMGRNDEPEPLPPWLADAPVLFRDETGALSTTGRPENAVIPTVARRLEAARLAQLDDASRGLITTYDKDGLPRQELKTTRTASEPVPAEPLDRLNEKAAPPLSADPQAVSPPPEPPKESRVSKEDHRLSSAPAVPPVAQYIAARRHSHPKEADNPPRDHQEPSAEQSDQRQASGCCSSCVVS